MELHTCTAKLFARTREALIAIADPRFKQELEDFALRAHYLERKAMTFA